MFPELHETFILRELVALERTGVAFDIFSLQFPRDPITLDDAKQLSSKKTHYSALFNSQTLIAFLRTFITKPWRLTSAMGKVVWIGKDRPMDVVKNLAVLPITLHFYSLGKQRGVVHWHGHWANIPTTSCWYLQEIFNVSWSAAIHGEDIFSPNRFLQHKLDAALFSVVCSDFFCQHLKNNMHLKEPEKIHLNYHGLDPRVMERAKQVSPPQYNQGEPLRLLSIGRLVPTKGHDVLIKACAQLIKAGKPVSLEIVGSGPIEQELTQLIKKEGVQDAIQLVGALAFEAVLEKLQACDVFCLAPRLIPGQPPDGIPNVIAEAMALKKPVITTRVSAIPELVLHQETGVLVDVDDVKAFEEAIAAFLDEPEQTTRFSHAASNHVANLFNQRKNIDELIELFSLNVPGGLPKAQETLDL